MEKELRNSVRAAYLEFEKEPMMHYYRHPIIGYASRLRVKKILNELGRIKGKTVLDAGCEIGYVSQHIEQKGAKVLAFDVVEPAIKEFKKKIKALKLNIRAFVAYAQKIPLKNNRVDAIVCTEVIEHMPQLEKVFAEFERVLKPGGLVVITFPNEGLRKPFYPFIKLFGINTEVEEDVTLFEHNLPNILNLLRKHFTVKKRYKFPWYLPLTHMVVCRKS